MSNKYDSGKTFGAVRAPRITESAGKGLTKAAEVGIPLSLLLAACNGAPQQPVSPVEVPATPAGNQGLPPTVEAAQATVPAAVEATKVPATTEATKVPATAVPTETSVPKVNIPGVGEVTQTEAALFTSATADYKAAYFMKDTDQVQLQTGKLPGTNIDVVTTNKGVPLLMRGEDGVWRTPGDKDLARPGFNTGTEINAWTNHGQNLSTKQYADILNTNYNTATPAGYIDEGFYAKIPNQKLTPDQVVQAYDWGGFDKLIGFLQNDKAVPNSIVMHLFNGGLMRRDNAPEWMKQMSDDELSQWQVKHMEALAARFQKYGIQPKAVSVINEMFWHDPSKTGMDGVFSGDYMYSRLGDKYVKTAFENARRLFPGATLLMNDDQASSGFETNKPYNSEAKTELNFIVAQRKAGVPIDGFGYEGHLLARNFVDGTTTPDQVDANIAAYKKDLAKLIADYKAAGVKFYITELDVNVGGLPANWTEQQKQELKAKLYAAVEDTALKSNWCNDVVIFGVADSSSWVLTDGYPFKPGEAPLPYDKNYKPTMSQYEIQKILLENR